MRGPGAAAEVSRSRALQPLDRPALVFLRLRRQLRRRLTGEPVAHHVAQHDLTQQVDLGEATASDLVGDHAVELREHRDVGQHLVGTPLGGGACSGLRLLLGHPTGQVAQAFRTATEAFDERTPIAVDQLIEEVGHLGWSEAGALDLHKVEH